MVTLILLLNASILALEQPSLMVVRMSSRRLRIFPHGSTISGMRQRDARPIHRLSSASARSTGWRRRVRRSSLSCHERWSWPLGSASASVARAVDWRSVRSPGFPGTAYSTPRIASVAVLFPSRLAWFHNRFPTRSSASVIQVFVVE